MKYYLVSTLYLVENTFGNMDFRVAGESLW